MAMNTKLVPVGAEFIREQDFVVEVQPCSSSIYPELAAHQREETCFGRDLIVLLQGWAAKIVVEFKLEIPEVVLCLESLPKNRYAHFRGGHNGFGLRGEIAFNTHYLQGQRELWEVLGTLLHELLHAWQQAHGKPGKGNHHNEEFRRKAWELGLIIDRRGATGYRDEPVKVIGCDRSRRRTSRRYPRDAKCRGRRS